MAKTVNWGNWTQEDMVAVLLVGLGYLPDDMAIHEVIKPWAAEHGMLGELGFEEEEEPSE